MSTVLNRPNSSTAQAVSIPSLLTVVGPKISTTTFARRAKYNDGNVMACPQMHDEYNLSDEVLYRWNQSLSVKE